MNLNQYRLEKFLNVHIKKDFFLHHVFLRFNPSSLSLSLFTYETKGELGWDDFGTKERERKKKNLISFI